MASHHYILKHSFLRNLARPTELQFHMENPYDRLAKIYTNCFGHMPKMATMPIYGTNPLKSFYPEPEGHSIGDVGPTKFAQTMTILG